MIANTSLGEPVKYCPRCRSELSFIVGILWTCADCHTEYAIEWCPTPLGLVRE